MDIIIIRAIDNCIKVCLSKIGAPLKAWLKKELLILECPSSANINDIQTARSLKLKLPALSDGTETYKPLMSLIKNINKLHDNEKVVLVDEGQYSNLDIMIWRKALSADHPIELIRYLKYVYPNKVHPRYDYYLFADMGYDQFLGEGDKRKRACRFCNRHNAANQSIFGGSKCAHAISYFLGNNTLYNLEECQDCNNRFGSIELDLANYYTVYRALDERKSRAGNIINASGFNYEYDSLNKRFSILIPPSITDGSAAEKHFPIKGSAQNIELETKGPVCLHNIYRILVKYVISCLPHEQLQYFDKTVKWVLGDKKPPKGSLPFVYRIETLKTVQSPSLGIYIRKDDRKDLPYCIAELRFSANLYVYAIPFCSKEKDPHPVYLNDRLKDFVHRTYPDKMIFTVQDFCDNEPKLIKTHIRLDFTDDTVIQPLSDMEQK